MVDDPHPGRHKSESEIASEWDHVAIRRDQDISAGRDLTYDHILCPAVLHLRNDWETLSVIDAGCGSGHLSERIATRGASVLGIDVSGVSISVARRRSREGLRFLRTSVQKYAARSRREKVDIVVANMLLQTTPDLADCLRSIASLLKANGELIATVPHPCFWPRYWDYERETWYDYTREIAVEAVLKTSLVPEGVGVTTHFHRSLSRYMSAFALAGFTPAVFEELFPDQATRAFYPNLWPYPRFIALKLRR